MKNSKAYFSFMEKLEDRVLFDAVPDAVLVLPESQDVSFPAQTFDLNQVESKAVEQNRELVLIDASVENFSDLVEEILSKADEPIVEVRLLNDLEDGIQQVTKALEHGESNPYQAIHIVAHGSDGELQIGNNTIHTGNLDQYSEQLINWRNYLEKDADILIYGCNVAASEKGEEFLESIGRLTQADVGASVNLTGSSNTGGDWDLEFQQGEIETQSLQLSSLVGTLSVEATESIVTIQDAENSGSGTISLSGNGNLDVTSTGTPFRVGQMLGRVWEFSETGDVGKSTFVFDISGIAGINGTNAPDFGLIVSDQANFSQGNTETLVASGYDSANGLLYFHSVDLTSGDFFGLGTEIVSDNFSLSPSASGNEDTVIDLGLTLSPSLTQGGTLQDIIGTEIGYRASNAGTTSTDFLIPAGTTSVKITGYSTLNTGSSSFNDDFQVLFTTVDLDDETTSGYIGHLVDQGPSRSDQFGWEGAPLGTSILTGGGTITGDANDNINPTFDIVDGVLKIVENHNMQSSYHVEFVTNATSSAEFLNSTTGVRERGDDSQTSLAIPNDADFLVINVTDAAADSDYRVEYKGNSRIILDLSTLRASGTIFSQRGEGDDRVINYSFKDYDVSSSGVGSVLTSGATVVGDSQENANMNNDPQIYIDGSGNLIISQDSDFADSFNSFYTVEYYQRRDFGSSAKVLGTSTDYQKFDSDPSNPTSQLNFDIPDFATLGVMQLTMNGTDTNNTNENMGGGYAIIDLENQTSFGSMYNVRTSNIIDFVSWGGTSFGDIFFDDPNSVSNHSNRNQFNDLFSANAAFDLNGNVLTLSTSSNTGSQSYLDYFAGAHIEWYGQTPLNVSFSSEGTFDRGSLNPDTGKWELTIEEASLGLGFIPDEHFSGSLPVEIEDLLNGESETVQVRVDAVIDPISFENFGDARGDEDTAIPLGSALTPTFVDVDGSESVTGITLSNIPIGHTLTDGTNTFVSSAGNQSVNIISWNQPSITYQAKDNESGTFPIDVEVNWQDIGGATVDTDTQSFQMDVIVDPVNDPPIAVDDSYSMVGNTTLTVTATNSILSNDTDEEGDTLAVDTTPVSPPTSGSVTLNSNGTFTYTPVIGFVGVDSFVYEVNDGNGGDATATVTINVASPVTGPLDVHDDTASTLEEIAINIDVYDNDDLPTTGAFSITSTTDPSNGSIVVNANGTIDYTPELNFFGTDTFSYTVTDAIGRTDTATVTVTVTNTQDPPVANSDNTTTLEDSPVIIDVLFNDFDLDNDPLVVNSATAPNGTVDLNPNGTITYTPNLNFTGLDTITYEISDGNGGTATSSVLINVTPVQDPPTSLDKTIAINEDSQYIFEISDFAFFDGDPADVLNSVRIDSLPTNGTLFASGSPVTIGQIFSPTDITTGKLLYVPDSDQFGIGYASFEFSVSDGIQYQDSPNTITLDVANVQDPPVATDNTISVNEESTGTLLGVSVSDIDNDVLSVTVTGLPTLGVVKLSNGTPIVNGQSLTAAQLAGLIYDAPSDYTSGDPGDFTYQVSDGIDTDIGTVDIAIVPINDIPVAIDDSNSTDEDSAINVAAGSGGILDNDSDVDLDTLSIVQINGSNYTPGTQTTLASGALLTVNAVGSYSYDPNGQFESLDSGDTASDSFTYQISDGNGATDTATVNFTINGINDEPTSADNTVTTNEDTDFVFAVSDFPFADVDSGDSIDSIRIESLATDGTLLFNGSPVSSGTVISVADITAGNLVFRPDADENGTGFAAFDFSVGDGTEFQASPNKMTVNVTLINDAPVAIDDSNSTDEDSAISVAAGSGGILDNDSDVDLDTLSIVQINGSNYTPGTQITLPSGVLLTVNADGSYSYDPNGQFESLDSGDTASDSFTCQISDGNGATDTATVKLTINGVNDEPTSADNTVTTNEDTDLVFAVADFPFADVDNGDSIDSIRIESLGSDGTLLLNGSPVSSGTVVAVADITAGNLVFRPDADEIGTGYATFDFSVGDGTEFQVSPNTMIVNVTPINDAPVAVDDANSTDEDSTINVAAGSSGILDNDSDVDLDTLSIVQINGSNYSPGTQITLPSGALLTVNADGNYSYDPNGQFESLDSGDIASDSFTYQISDGNGATDTATVNFTINGVNDEPTSADNTVTTDEDTDFVFAVADFPFADVDNGDSIDSIRIESLATDGTLLLNGSPVPSGTVVSVADIAAGKLVFRPDTNENGTGYAAFDFSVGDGTEFQVSPKTMTVNVTPINDSPVAIDDSNSTDEDSAINVAAGSGGILDNDSDVDLDTLSIVQINGSNYTPGTQITLPSGALLTVNADGSYSYDPNGQFESLDSGDTASDSFTYQISDGNGATDTATVNLTINGVNDEPTSADNTVTTNEDTDFVFAVADFPFADVDNGDSIDSIRIESLASDGALLFNGSPVSSGTVVAVADIAAGNLVFRPDTNENGTGYATFDFSVGDGTAFQASPNTMTVNVTPINDDPVAVDDSNSTDEDSAISVASGSGGILDNDSDVDLDTLSIVQINGSNYTPGTQITLPSGASLTVNADGSYSYDPNGQFESLDSGETASDSFTYQISDGNGATDTATVNFTINGVNDEPTSADNTVTANEDTDFVFAVADFPFTDVDNGDSIDSIRIESLATDGTLLFNGSPVSSGTVISVADIAAGNLVFRPDTNENGTGYATFDFSVGDGTEFQASPNTMTVNVSPINDAPVAIDDANSTDEDSAINVTAGSGGILDNDSDVDLDSLSIVQINGSNYTPGTQITLPSGALLTVNADGSYSYDPNGQFESLDSGDIASDSFTYQISDGNGATDTATVNFTINGISDEPTSADNAVTTDEDTDFVFAVADFPFADVDNGDSIDSIRIESLASDGTLLLNGSPVSSGTVVAVADITAGNLVFRPDTNENGTGYAAFDFSVGDGTEFQVSPNTMTVNVTPVNDDPVAVDDANSTDEDSAINVAAGSGGILDNDSDVDLDTLSIVQINGSNYAPGTQITLPSGALLTVNADGSYSYDPNGQFESLDSGDIASDSFTYQISDGNGATDTATVNFTINGINDEPTSADNAVTTDEDTDFVFAVADFPFADVDNGDSIDSIRIESLATDGTLLLNGSPVSSGTVISVADIAAGNLVFRPDADEIGTGYAAFDFSVGDGTEFQVSPNTMTVNVTPINDDPVAIDDANSTDEDSAINVAAGSGGILNNDSDVDLDTLSIVQINGSNYTPGTQITLPSGALLTVNADGSYSYEPNGQFESLDSGDTASDAFTYQINDGNGATDTATVNFTINGVNDEPTSADNTVTTDEDTDFVFAVSDFPSTDVDNGDSIDSIRIESLATDGTLLLNGSPVPGGAVVSVADIATGNLVFRPDTNENGTGYATFDFSVGDGTEFQASPNTMTVNVTPINDDPVAVDDSNSTDEDSAISVAAGSGGILDNDSDVDLDTLSIVQINGSNYTPGTQTTLASGALLTVNAVGSYSYDPNGQFESLDSGDTASDSFTYQISDGNGATDTATVNFTINGINDEPTSADNTVTTNEDTDFVFAVSDFPFADVDSGDSIDSIRIESLATDGTLLFNGSPVPSGTVVSVADIAAGNLVFRPDTNENGTGYAAFDFSVGDGTAFQASPNTMTVNVTPINDDPVAVDDSNSTDEDSAISVASGSGGILDNDSDVDLDTLSIVQINGSNYTPGTQITLPSGALLTVSADGSYSYEPNGQFESLDSGDTASDAFTYQINDGNGATDTATVNFTINGVNDEPTSADNAVTTDEDTDFVFAVADFPFADVDSGDSIDSIRIESLASDGTLLLNGSPVSSGTVISVADITAGNLVFRPDADEIGTGYATFDFSVGDGTEFQVSPNTMTVNVAPINDAPVAIDDSNSTDEDSAINVAAGSGGILDNDSDVDLDTLSIVQINGSSYSPGTQITLPSGALLTVNADGSYSYDPNGQFESLDSGDTSSDSFTYQISDGNGGTDAATAILTINGVNDEPTSADNAVTTNEDTDFVFAVADFPFADVDNGDSIDSMRIESLATDGTLLLNGSPVPSGTVVAVADISAGKLVFRPDTDENGTGYATFEFSVGDGTEFQASLNTMIVNVTPINDAPLAVDDANSTDEDSAINVAAGSGGILDNDSDVDLDTLSIVQINGSNYTPGTQIALPSGALLTVNADGSYSYDPNGQFESLDSGDIASDSFTYQISDGNGATDTATVNFTINGINDEPTSADNTVTTDEDTDFVFAVADFPFADVDNGDSIASIRIESLASDGALLFNGSPVSSGTVVAVADIAAGNLVFRPDTNENGTGYATFDFSVGDGTAFQASPNTMTVNVTPINDDPVAVDDSNSTDEDSAISVASGSGGILDNDSDVDLDTLSIVQINGSNYTPGTQITLPSGALLTVSADGSYSYEPNGQFESLDSGDTASDAFTYQINDGNGATDTATVNFTINGVNDEPTSADNAVTTNEDADYFFAVADFPFTDVDNGDSIDSIRIESLATDGTLLLNGSPVSSGTVVSAADISGGKLVFRPDTDENGTGYATFDFSVGDGTEFQASPNTMIVNVTPINDAPVAVDDANSTDEDSTINVAAGSSGILDNDSDVDLDTLSIVQINGSNYSPGTQITLPSGALLTVDADGSYSYDPNGQFESLDSGDTASDSFTYQITDGNGATDTATVNLTINGVNDEPTPADNTVTTNEDTDFVFEVADFPFADVDNGDSIDSIRIESLASDGTLLLNGSPVSSATVISVADITAGNLVFRPDTNENGTGYAAFDFSVGDGTEFQVSPNTMTVNVTPVNDDPVAVDDANSTDEDSAINVAEGSGGILDNDSDADLDTLSIVQINGSNYTPGTQIALPSGALLTVNADGSYSYDPNGQFESLDSGDTASDSFTYQISDGNGATDTATVNFTINGINDEPTSADNTVTTDEDTDIVFAVADFPFADVDNGDSIASIRIESLASDGALLFNGSPVSSGTVVAVADIAAGNLVFRPDTNENGTGYATFDFSVGDGTAFQASPNTMTVNVTPINDAPVAVDDFGVTDEDNLFSTSIGAGALLENDSDIDADSFSITHVNGFAFSPGVELTLPSGALLTVNENGTYLYNPNGQFESLTAGSIGIDEFTYSVDDGKGGSDIAFVRINILGVNDAPTSSDHSQATNEDTPLVFGPVDFPLTDIDLGNELAKIRIETLPTDGNLLLSGTPVSAGDIVGLADLVAGNLVFVPNSDFSGQTGFAFSVNDGESFSSSPSTISIDVNPVNDSPVGIDDSFTMNKGEVLAGNLLQNDSDVEDDPLTASLILGSTPPNGSLTLNLDGTFSYVPNPGFEGTDQFQYEVCDDSGDCNTVTVGITVLNQPPTPLNDQFSVSGATLTGSVATNDSDPNGDPLSFVVASPPSNGTLILNPSGTFTYVPTGLFAGSDSFKYSVCDDNGACTTATVSIGLNFAFDSMNDHSQNQRSARQSFHQYSNRLLSIELHKLTMEPILSGQATPGMILVGKLYGPGGELISQSQTQVSASGNWAMNFYNTKAGAGSYLVIEHVGHEDTGLDHKERFRLSTSTYRSLQLNHAQSKVLNVNSILADRPRAVLEHMQKENFSPLWILE